MAFTRPKLGADGVRELLFELQNAPDVYRPSPFWEELCEIGAKEIESTGFENFKRTVNMTYFNWGILGILRHQLSSVFGNLARHPSNVLRAKFPDYGRSRPILYHSPSNYHFRLPDEAGFNAATAFIYKTYVAMLWEYVAKCDAMSLLRYLDEPEFGHPFAVRYNGRSTSQDLCNSVHEFYSARGPEGAGKSWNVAELGGGYGRLSYVFLKALPDSTVCMIDIAPALNVAQEYMRRVFPNERVFFFRPFRDFEDVREEFDSSRIRFLASHQIELLPAKRFDLFLNISSLHEMTYAQIGNYLRQIDRLCHGRFYTKQWRTSQTAINGQVTGEFDYPIPSSWTTVFHRNHPVQRMFFHALYDTRATAGVHLGAIT